MLDAENARKRVEAIFDSAPVNEVGWRDWSAVPGLTRLMLEVQAETLEEIWRWEKEQALPFNVERRRYLKSAIKDACAEIARMEAHDAH